MAFKMKGWSPFTQKPKPRDGNVYVIDKKAVISDPLRNTNQFSTEPMYEGQAPSTHLMAYGSGDGKFYAYPTLFQDDGGNWYKGGFDHAKKKGEVYTFDTEQEAADFAAGNWKNK
jgi:hypothetical protein